MSKYDNKSIAKNTVFLYLRMLLTIIVNLYAVRVIWDVLGIEDYGIYNVVGGIVTMFAFLNNAMVASSQRFISFELGTSDFIRLKKIFSISITVHVMLAIAILVLAETIGLWFLNSRLNIPLDRMYAANWVYQCSIIAFIITVISVPYNACIVAHEHMKQYGYFGIVEVLLKLLIVFLLMYIPFDKLITYAILVVCISLIMRIIYGLYCRKQFAECHYTFVNDHHLMRDMFSFAGWSFIGNLGFSVRDQGLNIVVNLFFNVAVNAAKGIANQIGGVISGFAGSFQMALNPQITKRYASGDSDAMLNLVFRGCKFSAILMMFIVIPLFFCSTQVLTLWLKEVAPYTTGFMKLVLIMILIDSMAGPITTALQAVGHIKWFQIIVSLIMLSNIPLAWVWLKFELSPYIVLYVCIFTSLVALFARLILLHHEISFRYTLYINKVVIRLGVVFVTSYISLWWLHGCFDQSLYGLFGFIVTSLIIIGVVTFIFGLDRNERNLGVQIIKNKLLVRSSK